MSGVDSGNGDRILYLLAMHEMITLQGLKQGAPCDRFAWAVDGQQGATLERLLSASSSDQEESLGRGGFLLWDNCLMCTCVTELTNHR